MDIKELCENCGAIDLLTAYIVRMTDCSIESAEETAWAITDDVDRLIKMHDEADDDDAQD